jgi:HK97 gp10 family phage protein
MPSIRSTTKAFRERLVGRLPKALDKAMDVLLARVQANAPVDTGKLKRSIHALSARVEGKTIMAEVVVNAPHGHLEEFGTIHQAAHPFFRPAVRSEEPRMIAIVRAETK